MYAIDKGSESLNKLLACFFIKTYAMLITFCCKPEVSIDQNLISTHVVKNDKTFRYFKIIFYFSLMSMS